MALTTETTAQLTCRESHPRYCKLARKGILMLKAIFTDSHFWIPVAVLLVGIALFVGTCGVREKAFEEGRSSHFSSAIDPRCWDHLRSRSGSVAGWRRSSGQDCQAAAISPFAVSLCMVAGVFVPRWTIPALLKGSDYIFTDLKENRHLIVWGVLAGALWAVANTLTVFAIRDVGLSIAFPLWNTNCLIGIFLGDGYCSTNCVARLYEIG